MTKGGKDIHYESEDNRDSNSHMQVNCLSLKRSKNHNDQKGGPNHSNNISSSMSENNSQHSQDSNCLTF